MNDNKVYYQAIISNMIMQQTTLKNHIQSKSMDPNAIKIRVVHNVYFVVVFEK